MEQEPAGSPFGNVDPAQGSGSGVDAALGTPRDLDDIRRAAEAFNAAFNELLNESVISRRQLDERAGRITELDEALQETSRALQAEVDRYGQLERATAEQAEALRRELQETVNARDAELSAQAARLEQLGGEFESLSETSRTEREAHTREVAELGAQLEDLRGQLASTGQQLAQAGAREEELRRELQESGAERARLQEQGVMLQETVTARDAELSAQAARLEQLGGEFEELGETSRTEREAHAREVAELGAQLEDLRGQLASTGQQLAQGNAREEELRQELEVRARERDALNGEFETLQAMVAGLEQELREVAVARDEAAIALETTGEAYRELEAHAANLENLNNALHDSSVSEQNRSRKVIQMRDAEIQALHRRLERSGQVQDDTSGLQDELQQLQVRLAAAEQELGELDRVRSALQQAEQELATRSEQDSDAAAGHEEMLHLQEENGVLRQQVTDMGALRASLEATQAENFSLRSELQAAQEWQGGDHDMQQRLEALQAENAGLQQQLAVREQALAEMLRPQPAVETGEPGVPVDGDGMTTGQDGDSPAAVEVPQIMLPTAGDGMTEPVPDADGSREDVPDSAGPAPDFINPDDSGAQPVPPVTMQPAVFGNEADIVSGVLRGNRLKDLYQPISTLRGDTSGFYEVLVRVSGEDGRAITSVDFFAMAQRCGRSYDVDCHIIESALKELARDQSGTITLFIKLSHDSVANEELGMRVLKLVKQHKVSPGRLVFEVAEKNLRMDFRSVSSLARALHSIGCKVAVEHYTHATQVQHLKQIHADFLKIDASLVRDIGENGDKLASIKEIIDIARDLECKTIAEQVESPYSLTRLWSLGVDYAQGYFIQEPGTERGYDFDGKSGDNGKAVFHF